VVTVGLECRTYHYMRAEVQTCVRIDTRDRIGPGRRPNYHFLTAEYVGRPHLMPLSGQEIQTPLLKHLTLRRKFQRSLI
jgi:hypothetical protein